MFFLLTLYRKWYPFQLIRWYTFQLIETNKDEETEELRKQLISKGFVVIKKGETENLIPDEDIANMTGKTVDEVGRLKAVRPKLSETFEKELFGKSKPEIAYDIVDYYRERGSSPFDKLIKWVIND